MVTYTFSSVILPIFCTLFVLSEFRGAHASTTKNLVKPENHAKVVAAAMTGLIFTLYVYIHDAAASYHVINSVEFYRSVISTYTPHFAFAHVTLAFDSFFLISLILIWIYIIYYAIMQFLGFHKKFKFPPKLIYVISHIVGKENVKYLQKLSDNDIIAFTILYMVIPPIFMTFSHIGFIVAAWLVEPHKCTITLLVTYLFIAYCYTAFKKVYNVNVYVTFSTRPKIVESKAISEHQMVPLVHTPSSSEITESTESPNEAKTKDDCNGETAKIEKKATKFSSKICGKFYFNYGEESEYLNVQVLALSLIYGFFIVLLFGLALTIFVVIPSATESIFTYILNIFHILVVLVTVQLSFKIFFAVNFSLDQFMNVFRKRLSMKKETEANKNVISIAKSEAETPVVAGTLAADIADAVINKFKDD